MKKIIILFIFTLFLTSINCIEWDLTHKLVSTTALSDDHEFESSLLYRPELGLELFKHEYIVIDSEISNDFNFSYKDKELELTSKLYRSWLRYSSSQAEVRIGLQKINFGPAQILRSLQWFDSLDPNDPTQTTEGVKALLARYYFLNNANIWFWGIWGDPSYTSLDNFFYEEDNLEFGGRIQYPFQSCEAAFTYHRRKLTDFKGFEDRFGFDARWDFVIGLWTEISTSQKHNILQARYDLPYRITLGADYTLPIGLYILLEFSKFDQHKTDFYNNATDSKVTALSLSYPISLFDNISSIVTYNHKYDKLYSSFTYQRTYDYLSGYLKIFINPENNFFSNSSIQLILETKF